MTIDSQKSLNDSLVHNTSFLNYKNKKEKKKNEILQTILNLKSKVEELESKIISDDFTKVSYKKILLAQQNLEKMKKEK